MRKAGGTGFCHEQKSSFAHDRAVTCECRPPLKNSTCWACWGASTEIAGYYLVIGHPTCRNLPCELLGTSQLKGFA